jgi:nucleotide-binding universal stress UspA family protein
MHTRPVDPVIRSILLPLDGSKRAELALPVVEVLGKACPAEIKLLHIVEREAPAAVHGEPHLNSVEEAAAYLERIALRLRADGLTVTLHIHDEPERDVTQSIASHASELNADLVVLVAHGEGGWRNLVFGRVAQQVALRGHRPALVLQDRHDGTLAAFPPKLIAVLLEGPVDAEGEQVLPMAVAMARACGASLRLIIVVPSAEMSTERGPVATLLPSATRALADIERDAAVNYLEGHLARLREAGIPATAVVLRGEPVEEALPEAARSGAELLAIVTHPRSPLSGLLSGSVGARALARFDGSLLIVRSPVGK